MIFRSNTKKLCIECPYMHTWIYHAKDDRWEGWCAKLKIEVDGNDLCRNVQQVTEITDNIPDADQLQIKW